jgi:hypothetical protein
VTLQFDGARMMAWQELTTAFCLMLILEGMLPFLYPNRWKKLVAQLAEVDSRSMRIMGFASMFIGTALLYVIQ